MKIGIIGGGFTGISTAYHLRNLRNAEITVLEADSQLAGISSSFKTKQWQWPIDKLIHHFFSTDEFAFNIARQLGLGKSLIFKQTKSSTFYGGKIARLDSPISVLKFPFLPLTDRIRLGFVMAFLKMDNNYLKYEKQTSYNFIQKTIGYKTFKIMWEPLFLGKFGPFAEQINSAWFWSRVHSRTKKLVYFKGSFQALAEAMAKESQKHNAKIILNAKVSEIKKKGGRFYVRFGNKKIVFDYLILAVPLKTALKLYDFPADYNEKYSKLKSIACQYFVLELEKPFLEDGTYWLNVNDKEFPFMMVAEHTNFIDKKYYNNRHIIWVGKYLDENNKLWKMPRKKLLSHIIPYLKKINPKFDKSWIKRDFFARFKNAQPIIPLDYSKKMPKIQTPEKNLFIANMNHIYPWDRGVNNALILGKKAANLLIKKSIV